MIFNILHSGREAFLTATDLESGVQVVVAKIENYSFAAVLTEALTEYCQDEYVIPATSNERLVYLNGEAEDEDLLAEDIDELGDEE